MKDPIHISQAREIMNCGHPFDIGVWDSKGVPQFYNDVISLRYDVGSGTRNIKLMAGSGEKGVPIRKIRDALIFLINGIEVYY